MIRFVGQSCLTQRFGAVLAVTVVAGSAAALYHTGPAAAQADEFFLRAVGTTALKATSPSSINSFGLVCGPAGTAGGGDCVASASATMTVDASTKRKLKLTSAKIAKGASKPAGEGVVVKMVASAAVRKKLKGVKTLKVIYTVTATSPITETFKQTVVMNVTGAPKRLLIRSSADTFDFSGGGRG
jgi:hypothetical protein